MTHATHNNMRYSILLTLISAVLFPSVSHASYSFQGKTFNTFEGMQEYAVAYMSAWREVYSDTEAPVRHTTVTTRQTVGVRVSTSLSRDITPIGARLLGNVERGGKDIQQVWFEYGLSPQALAMRTIPHSLEYAYEGSSFNTKVQGLIPERTYYYRAVAQQQNGSVVYGKVRSFKTAVDYENTDALVQAQTGTVRDIDDRKATFTGSIQLKKEVVAYYWFMYGVHADDLHKRTPSRALHKGNSRSVAETVRGLDDETTYYVRAVAMDVNGQLNYGKLRTFKTKKHILHAKPIAKTQKAEHVGRHVATLTGSIDMKDFREGIAFFVYGSSRTAVKETETRYSRFTAIPNRGDERQKRLLDTSLSRDKLYTETITGLDPKTTHYYAIGVEYRDENNERRVVLGNITSFTTKR